MSRPNCRISYIVYHHHFAFVAQLAVLVFLTVRNSDIILKILVGPLTLADISSGVPKI